MAYSNDLLAQIAQLQEQNQLLSEKTEKEKEEQTEEILSLKADLKKEKEKNKEMSLLWAKMTSEMNTLLQVE